MTVAVIMNLRSGPLDRRSNLETFLRSLDELGAETSVFTCPQGSAVAGCAAEALEKGADTVVAAGGDGTVNAVAGVLAGTGKRMAVLPWGSLNHFARDIGAPRTEEEAARLIVGGNSISVDIGEVNGQIFLNNSSVGSYATSLRWRRAHQERGWPKWPALAVGVLRSFLRYNLLRVNLSANGSDWKTLTPFLFVGNNEYQMDGTSLGTRSDLRGGALHYCIAPDVGRAGLVRIGLRAVFSRLRPGLDYESGISQDLIVKVRRRGISVAFNGEVRRFRPPLIYRIRPRALIVAAPEPDPSPHPGEDASL